MLPANNRLKKGLFNVIYRRGKKEYGKTISINYAINEAEFSQFGFVVSKKNAPKAFQRNRIKRLMREAVRSRLKDVRSGYGVIFTFIDKEVNLSAQEENKRINEEIELLFSRTHLLKK